MVKIAFIVGKTSDTYPYKVTSKYAPVWLKEGVKQFKEFVNYFGPRDPDNNTVPSDVAMAVWIQYHHPGSRITLIEGTEVEKIKKKELDDQDVIFVIFDAIEVFHCGVRKKCPEDAHRMERLLATTKAFVYPHPDFHKYIINKPEYYSDLRKAGIPVAPFFSITPDKVIEAPARFKERILKKGWKGAIIKPSYAGYSVGIKVMKNVASTETSTIREVFHRFRDKGFPRMVVQRFVPSFSQHYEIRTYWINERYAYSVATLTRAVGTGGGLPIEAFDTFESEGGDIPDSVLRKLKPVARKVFRSVLQYPVKHPFIRVDFGCCISADNCLESYFVNEVETMAANMLADHTDYPAVERAAAAAYSFAKKMVGKKNVKGKKVRRTAKLKKMPCK